MTDERDPEPPSAAMSEMGKKIREALRLDEPGGLAAQQLSQVSLLAEKLPRIELPHIELDPDEIEQPANIRRLVEINRVTNEQLVALAEITGAALEESRLLRQSVTDAAKEQHSAGRWMLRLTWAIAGLTAVLLWQALRLPPF